MLFKETEKFETLELMMLKILLSGVNVSELKERLPRNRETIDQIMGRLERKRISDQNIENYLFDYETIVTAKHRAVKKQDYTLAAQLRDKEKQFMDLSYEWLFSDDFSDRHTYRSYTRYSSEVLINHFIDYLKSNI